MRNKVGNTRHSHSEKFTLRKNFLDPIPWPDLHSESQVFINVVAMKYGYARVSSDTQDYAAQVEALKAAGFERIFNEKARASRPMAGPSLPS